MLESRVAPSPNVYRADIDGIRAVAVLMVVLFHARLSWAKGGYLGVDVFLVISGYLIIGHLAQEASRTGTIALANFWARRARRLIPAATLVIITTLIVSVLVSTPTEFADHAKSARSAAIYMTNFLFLGYGSDYFRANADADPFLHTWSLSLEEQFYLVIAPTVFAITWLFARGRSGAPAPGVHSAPSRRVFVKAFGAVTFVSYALYVYTSRREPMRAFYMLTPRAWEFSAGGLAALAPHALSTLSESVKRWLGWMALTALVATMLLLEFTGRATYLIALVPVIATVVLLAVGEGSGGGGGASWCAAGALSAPNTIPRPRVVLVVSLALADCVALGLAASAESIAGGSGHACRFADARSSVLPMG